MSYISYVNKECKVIRKRSKKKGLIVALVIISAIIAGVVFFVVRNVNPVIEAISSEKIRAIATEAVSKSVLDIMSQNTSHDYISIVRDDKNSIKSVDINTDAINGLAHTITIEAQKNINSAGQDGITIPVGSLSGITLLTGIGPNINIKIYLVGSTQTQIISEFTDTGINQTSHRLYFDIQGSVAVAVPGLKSNVKTSTRVLMSETIIVGDVPSTYLHAVSVGDMLDLAA